MAMDAVSLSVMYFAILLGFGILIANVLKKRNIPDTFFLLLLGLAFGPTLFANPAITQYVNMQLVDVEAMGMIPDFFRTLALILVIFIGTFNLNFRVFKKYSNISLKLAFVGVLFNTVVLGFVAHFLFGMELLYSMLLGAVISGTGSGVVCAFEHALHKCRSAITILKVESIFNSPISVLVPLIFLDLVSITQGALLEPMKYLSQFWLMITAGVGTGLIVGLAVSRIFKGIMKEYSSLLLFAIALITYALAIGVGGSGMLAVAICGLVAGNFTLHGRDDKEELLHFEDQFSEMLRIAVFTLLGAQVTILMNMEELATVLIFFVMVVLVRPVMLLFLMGHLKDKFSRRDILLMSFIAPRGLSSAAMIPIVAAAVIAAGMSALATQMVNIVFMVILLSVLFSTIVGKAASIERFSRDGKKKDKKEEKEEKESPEKSEEEKKAPEEDVSSMLVFEDQKEGGE
jgi:cell volume regulation protein A